jgi:hypothetical protein
MTAHKHPLVLLGAGASVEAGIPDAKSLTRVIYEDVQTLADAGAEAKAIRVVLGGLGFHRAVVRDDPFGPVDVEELYEALLSLGSRQAHELSPFISAWNPAVLDADHQDLGESTQNVAKALKRIVRGTMSSLARRSSARHDPVGPWGEDLYAFGLELERALLLSAGRNPYPSVFKSAARRIQRLLVGRMYLRDAGKVVYLVPLVRAARRAPLWVVSLNFDNCIEMAADAGEVPVDVGLQEGSCRLAFGEECPLRLVKLHGSVLWRFEPPNAVFKTDAPNFDDPSFVFGAGNKLRVEGPFLDLLLAAREQLNAADDIIVIGYSFRDRHVNHLLLSWVQDGHPGRIIVADPKLDGATIERNVEAAWRGDYRLKTGALAARLTLEPLPASEAVKKHFPTPP